MIHINKVLEPYWGNIVLCKTMRIIKTLMMTHEIYAIILNKQNTPGAKAGSVQ